MRLAATQLQTIVLMMVICHKSRLGFGASFVRLNYISDTTYEATEFLIHLQGIILCLIVHSHE